MPRVSRVRAAAEVASRDPAMAAVMERVGPVRLRPAVGDAFGALARAVTYQQVSGHAGTAIYNRFLALFDEGPSPAAVLALPEGALRSVGQSGAKSASILDLATKATDGTVPLERLGRLTDDQIVERLTQVRGIGRWTAEMFLIFELRRLDVWPVDDYAVRKGWARIHGQTDLPTPRALQPLGDTFRPYRTVAAWYCWRSLDAPLET